MSKSANKSESLAIVSEYPAGMPDGRVAPGRGPAKGSGGRPPDAWVAAMRELASRDEHLEKVRQVLADTDHPAWLGAYRFAAEHGYGKPKEQVEHSGTVGLQIQFVRERSETTSSDTEPQP